MRGINNVVRLKKYCKKTQEVKINLENNYSVRRTIEKKIFESIYKQNQIIFDKHRSANKLKRMEGSIFDGMLFGTVTNKKYILNLLCLN